MSLAGASPAGTGIARIYLGHEEDNRLVWKLNGDITSQAMTLNVKQADPVNIIGATSSNDDFRVGVRVVKRGFIYSIVVTPAGHPPIGKATIVIRTDYPKAKPREFEGTAEVSASGK